MPLEGIFLHLPDQGLEAAFLNETYSRQLLREASRPHRPDPDVAGEVPLPG